MRPKLYFSLKAFVFFALLLSSLCQRSLAQINPTGRVIISSLDRRDWIVTSLHVLIEGENLKQTYASSVEELIVDLPPGTYQISATHTHYYPFRRSPFQIRQGETVRINLFPTLRVLSQALVVDDKGRRDEFEYAPPPEYEMFSLSPNMPQSPQLQIRFHKQENKRGFTEYSSTSFNMLMASYGNFAIYADKMRFSKQDLMLEASGNVIFGNGSNRTHHANLRIRFINGQAVIIPD